MPKVIVTTLKAIWYCVVWFLALVATAVAFDTNGFNGQLILLGIFWLIYLSGLWLEKTFIHHTAWAMLLGFAIGMIRMLDLIPNQQQYAHWLRLMPKPILGTIGLAFILIFVGVLPLIAKNIIQAHQAKNRVLGRDF